MKHFLVEIDYLVPVEALGDTIRLHREFLQTGYERGWLLLSGPRMPATGGIVITRAPSLEDLQAFFEEDPYRLKAVATHRFTEFNPVKHQCFLAEWVSGELASK